MHAFARSTTLRHPPLIMSTLAALVLAASAVAPSNLAPVPSPAEAAAILAEVKRPGAAAVLVNVWATWCAPCREDFAGGEEETRKFLSSQGVDFPTFMRTGKDEAFVDGLESRWTGAIPATFVYDGGGKLVRFWEGKASYPVIKKRALEALETKEKP